METCLRLAFFVVVSATVGISSQTMADETGAALLSKHLRSGEFVSAKQLVHGALPERRDNVLAQVARSQLGSGNTTAAAETLRDVDSPTERESAIGAGQGGNSFADFDSLIELIQTTVVPDTWEALGGPSTMSEYPQGIYVDSEGTVRECERSIDADEAKNLRVLLAGGSAGAAGTSGPANDATSADWRAPASLRFVSLKRLRDEIAARRIQGTSAVTGTRYLAGLSSVQYVMLTEDDVVLAGPVGGIEEYQGWHRDAKTKLHAIRSDFLFACLASAMSRQPFGCTIDPTGEGLRRTAALAKDVKQDHVPLGQAAERMKEALGMQRVEVFGTAANTPLGYLMVEADHHMKQLALGQQPLPHPAMSYLDVVDAMIDQGAPNDLLLRLWFTSDRREIRSDSAKQVFELSGTPIRLSGQNERAVATGERGHHAVDPRTQAFVSDFNRHWGSIRQAYPIYAALESIYRCASIAEILERYASPNLRRGLLSSLASESSSYGYPMPTPRQVESIATMHTVRHGRTRHHVLLASGGVAVDPQATIKPNVETYPSLDSVVRPSDHQPRLVQRWWFDRR